MGVDRLERLHSNICSVLAQLHPLGPKNNLRNILPVLTPHLSSKEWKELRLLYFTVGGSSRNKNSVQEWLTAPSAFCSSLLFLYVAASKIAGRPTVKEPKSQERKTTVDSQGSEHLPFKKKKEKLQVVTYTEGVRACVCASACISVAAAAYMKPDPGRLSGGRACPASRFQK